MYDKLAHLLQKNFSTSQNYYLEQQHDGSYRKRSGKTSIAKIIDVLERRSSIAVLQKNKDSTVNWICFDFDIKSDALDKGLIEESQVELQRTVQLACKSFDRLNVRYLLEFSGNRGFHIWITFARPQPYRLSRMLQQAILNKSEIKYNEKIIAIDLFPKSSKPSSGIGNGVKLPLSLHQKSGFYSRLLHKSADLSENFKIYKLEEKSINENIEILAKHTGLSDLEIKDITDGADQFELEYDRNQSLRINNIRVLKEFSLEDLLSHWDKSLILKSLSDKIKTAITLNNNERKLIVGLISRIQSIGNFTSNRILHEIFIKGKNYNATRTAEAIKNLSFFYFPSQHQIEDVVLTKAHAKLTVAQLLTECIPHYQDHLTNVFELSQNDIDVSRVAELNYIRSNDEVRIRSIEGELTLRESVEQIYTDSIKIINNKKDIRFFTHKRHEPGKIRSLVSLCATERVITSAIIKQIAAEFELEPSENSYGYRLNPGFKGGHIFEPWLVRWSQFTNNIVTAIEDPALSDSFIVKTDIKSFYDRIPHDNIKRLLLEGATEKMSTAIRGFSPQVEKDYKQFIDLIFNITQKISANSVGLPQGPAYARWLAEVYLFQIDLEFEKLIGLNRVQLYQRFVDDIFFIARDQIEATERLEALRRHLEALGLEINPEKTQCLRVSEFLPEFNKYRSRSKYAVDRISRNYEDSTEEQKNNAVSELLKLIQSDTNLQDLSFIYSHLSGVDIIDKWKRDNAPEILSKNEGRGSLFRHLFRFVLDDPLALREIEKFQIFGELQSEVFTEVLLEYLDEHPKNRAVAIATLDVLHKKLVKTKVVKEHLACISIQHNWNCDISIVGSVELLNSLISIEEPSALHFPEETVRKINTELNNIAALPLFTKVIYNLAAAPNIDAPSLEELSKIFFAKIIYEHQAHRLTGPSSELNFNHAFLANLYYLMCLFSVSGAGTEVTIKAIWSYFLNCSNKSGLEDIDTRNDDWLKKIERIEVNRSNALLILASIVDGNIVRSADDRLRLFDRFHSALLVFFALGEKAFDKKELDTALSKLKNLSKFYGWLVAREGVAIFPSSKAWFDRNLIDNDTIILRKGNEILIRKPTIKFRKDSTTENDHLDFSEITIQYKQASLASIRTLISEKSIQDQLGFLSSILKSDAIENCLPNFFHGDAILDPLTKKTISPEVERSETLVFEEANGDATSHISNRKNFISLFLRAAGMSATDSGKTAANINNKYVAQLGDRQDIFVIALCNQLALLHIPDDKFSIDIAAAAAYSIPESNEGEFSKILSFVNIYHKFNPKSADQQIYAIGKNTTPSDDSPVSLLRTIVDSLAMIRENGYGSLLFFLDKDVEEYERKIIDILKKENLEISLQQFVRAVVKINHLDETININGVERSHVSVALIHSANNCLREFSQEFSSYLDSATHIYSAELGDKLLLIVIPPAITKIYRSIQLRRKEIPLANAVNSFPSPPAIGLEELPRWTHAVEVVAANQAIGTGDAGTILECWLRYIPRRYHSALVELLAAHEVMTADDREAFLQHIETLLGRNSSLICLKSPEDYSGTHRLLYTRDSIGRRIGDFNPTNLAKNSKNIIVVTDLLVSGSQTSKCLDYYFGEANSPKGCYILDAEQRALLRMASSQISQITICCVLYTDEALFVVRQSISRILGREILVEIGCGRNIGGNAFFETTEKLSAASKSKIRDFLLNPDVSSSFQSLFRKSGKRIDADSLGRLNLVARYKSVPKHCFWFFAAELKAGISCTPLIRVQEVS